MSGSSFSEDWRMSGQQSFPSLRFHLVAFQSVVFVFVFVLEGAVEVARAVVSASRAQCMDQWKRSQTVTWARDILSYGLANLHGAVALWFTQAW